LINKLKSLLTNRDKQLLFALIFFSIIISLVETAGISVIMPFIAVATDFNTIHNNEYYSYIYELFNFEREVRFVIAFGLLLMFFYLFRSVINLLYFYFLNKFTQGRYHHLASRLFANYMDMPYKNYMTQNSSTLTKSIVTEAANLTQLISAVLLMCSEVFVVIFIYALMLYVDYKITLVLTVILLLNALLMVKTVSVKIKKAGELRAESQKMFYEIVNRSFGNFKLIKLQKDDSKMLSSFEKYSSAYAEANITNYTLMQVPRLFLEAIAFTIVIAIITYMVWKYESNISSILALISMFILALYRLMPSINRIMSSYNQILFLYKSLDIVHHDLEGKREELSDNEILFNAEIVVNNLSFEYESGKEILKNINLTIAKGSKIAFIGESGSGKSTLVDIIIGLYTAKRGEIVVDNKVISSSNLKSWRSKVGYIPQSVYLFDGTVGENIAFGLEYDKFRVDDVLKKAKIYDFLNSKEGQETLVGEGGVMLSGGQKQRIAIARALYSNPEILVLDEATSALDDETEKEIMDEIYELSDDKTLIIIAHRLSTIDRCDEVYKLDGGKI
jgi:ABC-type multidrug transport system fused ATPase/permease subunit